MARPRSVRARRITSQSLVTRGDNRPKAKRPSDAVTRRRAPRTNSASMTAARGLERRSRGRDHHDGRSPRNGAQAGAKCAHLFADRAPALPRRPTEARTWLAGCSARRVPRRAARISAAETEAAPHPRRARGLNELWLPRLLPRRGPSSGAQDRLRFVCMSSEVDGRRRRGGGRAYEIVDLRCEITGIEACCTRTKHVCLECAQLRLHRVYLTRKSRRGLDQSLQAR